MPTPPSATKVVTNKAQFDAAVKNTAIKTIKLGANFTGNVTADRVVNVDLGGHTLTGNLEFNTTQSGTITLSNGTVTGTLTIDTVNASFVNDGATVQGTTTIVNVAPGTFTNKGTLGAVKITDADGTRFVNATGATIGAVEVATAGNVTLEGSLGDVTVTGDGTVNIPTITNNASIQNFKADSEVKLINNATVAEVSGTAPVTLTGTGTVEEVTNSNPVVNESNQDAYLTKSGDLTLNQDRYESSFKWGSINGVGSGEKSAHTSPGGYNYFGNGAYLDITVKKDGEQSNAKFDDVLSQLTLQTNGGTTDDISGGAKTDGRQPADWGKSTANPSFATRLKESGSNAVFYGVRQNNTNGVATVGFNAGEKRDVNLTFSPKDGLAEGTYTITIQPKQQTGETTGKPTGNPITYTFTILAPPVE
ncbi:hypothetical protein SporoP37_12150 [Sporosarcina sp. P37]|uniref:hypothetical protein n=1 Tax=unclassified Sporosarcina TaxID=2647733 RepID=UPI000A17C8C2|nr:MULTISPECIES: hypothetical protein [unclassified Sporosarcina]ARK25334.1 hypothetical protein SporoP37_12150 [Sporosarcina sp. P37]PID16273.1 hypothetical protein CSV62_15725 [Sporosarcina sp. P35]